MAFHINWERMDREFAREAEQLLTKALNGGEKRPDFLGKITVSNFSFGEVPPTIEVTSFTEPYEEFYVQSMVRCSLGAPIFFFSGPLPGFC